MPKSFALNPQNDFMPPDTRIFVAGHLGLVGSAITRTLQAAGYSNLLLCTRAELDLLDRNAVATFSSSESPEFVFLAAARVGGILANTTYPADFIHDNLILQTNLIETSHSAGVRRLLFLGSSCVYPKLPPQPMPESCLLTGPLPPPNRPYAIAKIADIEMCRSYNRQYGTRYLVATPTNLYGPGDNFDLENSPVLPAIIRKTAEAASNDQPTLSVWGSGTPRREFMYSDDLAEACLFLMNLDDERFSTLLGDDTPPLINIGTGEDISIRELAELVANVLGFRGEIVFAATKTGGTPRMLMNLSRLNSLGWRHSTKLEAGIRRSWDLVQGQLTAPRSSGRTP